MEDIFSDSDLLNRIENNLIEKLKYLHVFDKFNRSVLFVTIDDKVYSFGANLLGKCGFGHNNSVDRPQEVIELRNKRIKEFFIGGEFVVALSEDNILFGWGKNNNGQLGRGLIGGDNAYLKPSAIYFTDKSEIKQISCGFNHTLCLTSNEKLYGWGCNKNGQIGFDENTHIVTIPVLFNFFSELKIEINSIKCNRNSSFAITSDGRVYYSGETYNQIFSLQEKNIYQPKLIENVNFVNEIFFKDKIYILCGKEIYYPHYEQIKFIGIFGNLKGICSCENITIILRGKSLFEIEGDELKKIPFESDQETLILDFYKSQGITNKTMNIDVIKCIITSQRIKIVELLRTEKNIIGRGTYGKVAKVKLNNVNYAIKKILIISMPKNYQDKNSEINIMKKVKSDFIANFHDFWSESDYFYIRMELCDYTLRDIINKMKCLKRDRDYFDRTPFVDFNYSIFCFILKQILESVNYLHSRKDPIIHRDIKPSNILIKLKGSRIVKICDFGLSRFHDKTDEKYTSKIGHESYRAPEVDNGYYTEKADIYSIGKMAKEMLDIIMDPNYLDMKEMETTFIDCLHGHPEKRPSCKDILSKHQFTMMCLNRNNCFENGNIDIYQPLPNLKEALCPYSRPVSKLFWTLNELSQLPITEEKREVNILIFGDVGVGRSTFINAFANYLTYETFDDVREYDLVSLTPCSFSFYDENFQLKNVDLGDFENISNNFSKECHTFKIEFAKRRLRLINTPAFVQKECEDETHSNIRNILSYLKQYKYLHCILIFLKPEQKILTNYRYFLEQIFSYLNPSFSTNILFVFTNSRPEFYDLGTTGVLLKYLLDGLRKKEPNMKFKFNKDNVFCYDNIAFKALMSLEKGIDIAASDIKEYREIWNNSAETCLRMIMEIFGTNEKAGLTPINFRDIKTEI